MKVGYRAGLGALFALSAGSVVFAQTYMQPELLETTLIKVGQTRTYFYSGDDHPGCPALTPACRRGLTYLSPGDVALAGATRGQFTWVTYPDRTQVQGWLPSSGFSALPTPDQPTSAWIGDWVRDEKTKVTVKTTRWTDFIELTAVWANPAGDNSGKIITGSVDVVGKVWQGRARLDQGGPGCHMQTRLIGPYLVISDNGNCMHLATYTGVYRKAA